MKTSTFPTQTNSWLLRHFLEGTLILGGDFNFTLDSSKDSSVHSSSLPQSTRLHLKDLLHDHQLVDIWRIFHPQEQDYFFYSPTRPYSRITFLLLKQSAITLASKADIGQITLSNHAPVFLELTLPHPSPKAPTCCLNEMFLRDSETTAEILSKLIFC